MKRKFKLKKGHIILLKSALSGTGPERLVSQIENAIHKKTILKADRLQPSITILDDSWDGAADKNETLVFNMDEPMNRLAFFLSEKFGEPFGNILFGYLVYAERGLTKKERDRQIASLQKGLWRDVDFGELNLVKD